VFLVWNKWQIELAKTSGNFHTISIEMTILFQRIPCASSITHQGRASVSSTSAINDPLPTARGANSRSNPHPSQSKSHAGQVRFDYGDVSRSQHHLDIIFFAGHRIQIQSKAFIRRCGTRGSEIQ
jgi:hypothetical protein